MSLLAMLCIKWKISLCKKLVKIYYPNFRLIGSVLRNKFYRLRYEGVVEVEVGSVRYYCRIVTCSGKYKVFKIMYICSYMIILSLITSQSEWSQIQKTFKISSVYTVISALLCMRSNCKKHKILLILFKLVLYTYACIFYFFLFYSQQFMSQHNIMIAASILIALQLI